MSLKTKVVTALVYEDSIKIAIDKVMDENNLHQVTITYEDDDTVSKLNKKLLDNNINVYRIYENKNSLR